MSIAGFRDHLVALQRLSSSSGPQPPPHFLLLKNYRPHQDQAAGSKRFKNQLQITMYTCAWEMRPIRYSLQQASTLTAGKPGQLATFLSSHPLCLTWSSLSYGCFRRAKPTVSECAEKDDSNPVQKARGKPGNSRGRARDKPSCSNYRWRPRKGMKFPGQAGRRRGKDLAFRPGRNQQTQSPRGGWHRAGGDRDGHLRGLPCEQGRNPGGKCFRRSPSVYSRCC